MIHLRALRDKIALRETAPSIFLVFNSFVWYILTYAVFYTIVTDEQNLLNLLATEKMELFIIYYLGVVLSALLGPKFFPRARTKLLSLWPFMGAMATLFLTMVSGNGMLTNALFAFFLSVSIGVGLPSCLSYFADSTSTKNRSSVGGIIWGAVGFAILIFAFLINTLGPWETIITLTVWRLFGGVGFLALNKKPKKVVATQKSPSYLELIRKREILLYLFPWVMFSIINFAEAPILESVFGATTFAFIQLIEYAFIGIFAIVGGIIADVAGRKKIVIAGFVMLGIEYAALSVFSQYTATLYLFLFLDGITWGLFASVFFTALWGDLGENREKEKYYALGGLPYLVAGFLPILIRPYVSGIDTGLAFTLASFFLFMAVIPLMYAPETLPEKVMKDRDLQNYVEKAKQKAQKEAEKSQQKQPDKAEKEAEKAEEEPEESPEDAEARKLAEKYY